MSSAPAIRRVAVTGVSVLSPFGVGLAAWRSRPSAPPAAPIPDFDAAAIIANPRLLRSMHRCFQIASAVAVLAMQDAGLPTPASLPAAGLMPERAGVAAALADLSPLTRDVLELLAHATTSDGPVDWSRFAELGVHELHPFRRLTLLANMAAAHASLLFGLQGPSFTITSGASGGGQCVVEAYWTIATGRADLMLCQAADASEQIFLPEARAELGAALVLEELEAARRRAAPIYAEVAAAPFGAPKVCFDEAALHAAEAFPSPISMLLRAVDRLPPTPAREAPARFSFHDLFEAEPRSLRRAG